MRIRYVKDVMNILSENWDADGHTKKAINCKVVCYSYSASMFVAIYIDKDNILRGLSGYKPPIGNYSLHLTNKPYEKIMNFIHKNKLPAKTYFNEEKVLQAIEHYKKNVLIYIYKWNNVSFNFYRWKNNAIKIEREYVNGMFKLISRDDFMNQYEKIYKKYEELPAEIFQELKNEYIAKKL